MERIVHMDVTRATETTRRNLQPLIEEVIGALEKKGVVAEEDQIYVVLHENPVVPLGQIGRRLKVEDVFRDGENGPVDVVPQPSYTVDID